MSWKRDFTSGFIMFLFSIISIVYSLATMEFGKGDDFPFLARNAPYLLFWLGLFGILSVILMINSFKKRDNENANTGEAIWSSSAILTIVMVFLYVILVKVLGFIYSTFVFTFIIMLLYGSAMHVINLRDLKSSRKKILIYFLVSVGITMAVYVVFGLIFNMYIPPGSLL